MQRWVPSKHMAMVHVEISGTFFYMTQEYTCWCPLHTFMPQLVGFAPIQLGTGHCFQGWGHTRLPTAFREGHQGELGLR